MDAYESIQGIPDRPWFIGGMASVLGVVGSPGSYRPLAEAPGATGVVRLGVAGLRPVRSQSGTLRLPPRRGGRGRLGNARGSGPPVAQGDSRVGAMLNCIALARDPA